MGLIASNRYTDEGISDYWRLNDVFTIKQAALLIIGTDPQSECGTYCEQSKPHERPEGYEAAKQALTSNLLKGIIQGKHFKMVDTDINGNPCGEIDGTTDIELSTVNRDSVSVWIQSRGIYSGFFQLARMNDPDYLDPNNPRYAPKLAAAVKAWQAVTDPNGKSPKQALDKWIREHAADFRLTDDDGNPINQAIEDCSKVANWQPGGGAAKTPGA